jgi:hypothetical protein
MRSTFPILLAFAAGLSIVAGTGCTEAKTGSGSVVATPVDPADPKSEPPEAFDHADGERSLHWWVKARDKSPSAIKDKKSADWQKERNEFISSKPVRWKVRIARIDENGLATISQIRWPLFTKENADHYRDAKLNEWTFDTYELKIPGTFPVSDPEWAKSAGAGAEAIFVGVIDRIEERTTTTPIRYADGGGKTKKEITYTAIVTKGTIEKP